MTRRVLSTHACRPWPLPRTSTTHAYRDGVVVTQIVADVMGVEGRHSFGDEVGREAELDGDLVRVHDLLRGFVEVCGVP